VEGGGTENHLSKIIPFKHRVSPPNHPVSHALSTTPPPVLQIRNLSIERKFPILRNVNWTVQPGENWVILGANGSGKTSLLNTLLGYLSETRGSISFGDSAADDLEQWDALRRRIGFVSASIAQMIEPDEPAEEVVLSGRYAMINYWRPRTPLAFRQQALTIMRRIACTRLIGQPWETLSQGERQRILVGRTLMAESLSMLILDEPCAGLDPVARQHFLDFLQKLLPQKRAGKQQIPSLLLVTHHVEEIIPIFTHVLILKNGRVLAAGEKRRTLTSANLSDAFNAEIKIRRKGDCYSLAIQSETKKVFS